MGETPTLRKEKENLMIRKAMVAVSMFVMMLAGAAQVRAADTYKIDPVHATVIYRISHFNVGNAYGRFNEPTGSVTVDNEDPSKSVFEFSVQVDKVDTANPKRDAHLKSPDFFNAKQFPTIDFKSTKVAKKGDNQFELTGDLTLHGVTKSVTFDLQAQRLDATTIEVLGEIPIHFPDYDIANPSGGPAQVGDDGTLEFLVRFAPS
jgi:polyisoprenoid-binding protein YceI